MVLRYGCSARGLLRSWRVVEYMVGSGWLRTAPWGWCASSSAYEQSVCLSQSYPKKFYWWKVQLWSLIMFLPISAGCTNSVSAEQTCQTRSVTRATFRNENTEGITTQEVATKTVLLLWSFLSVHSFLKVELVCTSEISGLTAASMKMRVWWSQRCCTM
jgi:hypothetical protein